MQDNVTECTPHEITEQAEHHYLRRWQIWAPAKANIPTTQNNWHNPAQEWGAPVHYAWQPYDPSSVEPAPPREDIENYFYLNVRYNRDGTTSDPSSDTVLIFSQRNPVM